MWLFYQIWFHIQFVKFILVKETHSDQIYIQCLKLYVKNKRFFVLFYIWRANVELNEEATEYLQDFPKSMIFHTSNLHLLDSVGQGEQICEQVCCILTQRIAHVTPVAALLVILSPWGVQMRSRPILALMLHQDWQVCTVWRYSQSVFEHHTLWAEPRHVLGSTPPGPITYQNRWM